MTFRPVFGLLHRYVGLTIAGFLIMSGLTGAVISWTAELERMLSPEIFYARTEGPPKPTFEIVRQIEARYPQVQVTEVLFEPDEPGLAIGFGVSPRVNPATNRLYEPGFNAVYIDPASGLETGKVNVGKPWPITRANFMSFLYVLHYSLHIPELWGIDLWGAWLLGSIAFLWTIDCFVGFYLTLPRRERALAIGKLPSSRSWWQRWKPAWLIRRNAGGYKLNFDIHRAFGLWLWPLLFIIAFTAFSLNLYREVFFPAMSVVSNVTPSPFDLRTPADKHQPIAAQIGFERALDIGRAGAAARGWEGKASMMYYANQYGIYGVVFPRPGDGHDGIGGVGHREIYIDGLDGSILGDRRPWHGTAADIFLQAQFPLHSGRILGLPGRILSSLLGLIVATLSITGLVIWWRKRAARVIQVRRRPRRPTNTVGDGGPLAAE
jgi:uncharacterized iron-regulated membrane protein